MNTDKTAELISRRRKMKNLTQKELAMQLGVTDKAVSKWERG
ncbi:MAG TPA: helix-turn-helix domain-containing protein, partial [Lachnospiraceae bacterium]|nr:helix-turn-helix domain-containing protein [Lachnospiraceae bacterium]